MLGSFLLFISASIGIIWSLPFLFSAMVGLTLHKLSGRKMTCFLSKHVKISSLKMNDEMAGWVCGKWFIGYVYESVGQQGAITKDLFLLITQKQLIKLSDGNDSGSTNSEQNNKIDFLEREGLFWNLTYPSRPIDVPEEQPWESQEKVIQQIVAEFNEKKYATFLLSGDPKSGKSMVALYLCKHLRKTCKKVTLVDTWKPTDPGDSFGALYNKINPSVTEPMVVLIEEVDVTLLAIHRNEVKTSASLPMPIQIMTKPDWNQFFDRFDRKMYPGVALGLTTNKPLQWFNDLDSSYTRDGRINLRLEM